MFSQVNSMSYISGAKGDRGLGTQAPGMYKLQFLALV